MIIDYDLIIYLEEQPVCFAVYLLTASARKTLSFLV